MSDLWLSRSFPPLMVMPCSRRSQPPHGLNWGQTATRMMSQLQCWQVNFDGYWLIAEWWCSKWQHPYNQVGWSLHPQLRWLNHCGMNWHHHGWHQRQSTNSWRRLPRTTQENCWQRIPLRQSDCSLWSTTTWNQVKPWASQDVSKTIPGDDRSQATLGHSLWGTWALCWTRHQRSHWRTCVFHFARSKFSEMPGCWCVVRPIFTTSRSMMTSSSHWPWKNMRQRACSEVLIYMMLEADKFLWQEIITLVGQKWKLDDALNEMSMARADMYGVLQPRPRTTPAKVPPPQHHPKPPKGPPPNVKKQQLKQSPKVNNCPSDLCSFIYADGTKQTLCQRFQ